MAQFPDLEHYDQHIIVRHLNGLPLYELVRFNETSCRMQMLKKDALARRTELTIAFGERALDLCRNSKLWHEYQNDFKKFAGGWYETMHGSYCGLQQWLSDELYEQIVNMFPNSNITTLHVMVDFCSVPEDVLDVTVRNVGNLIEHYSETLVNFKLWARGAFYYRPYGGGCTLRDHFFQHLWDALLCMTRLRTLWLDLAEVVRDVPQARLMAGEPSNRPLNEQLELLLRDYEHGTFRSMVQLEEFRYTSDYIVPFGMLLQRLAPIASLGRICILYPQTFQDCDWCAGHFAQRFREIDLHLSQPATGRLMQLFSRYNALTRLDVKMSPDTPRFVELFRALQQSPNLQVLKLVSSQSSLFTLEETVAITRNRPAPLSALQILFIRLDITLDNCSSISFAPLFRDKPTEWPFPLPSLMCFEMVIREGACTACSMDQQNVCIRRAVIQWFLHLPKIVLVTYTNEAHRTLNREHVVGGNLAQPQLYPQQLDQ